MALSYYTNGLPSEGHKKAKAKEMAKKMESKTYTHVRCGKCNRFGHSHDKCKGYTGRKGEYTKTQQGNFMKVHPLDRI